MNSPFDAHVEELMSQFRERLPLLKQLEQLAFESLNRFLKQQGLYVTAIEHRVKDEKSLQKKLELKGNKYHSIDDVTDLIGLRIITFYTDDVDKIAAIVKNEFELLQPIVSFANSDSGKKFLESLRSLSGNVRNVDKRHKQSTYKCRVLHLDEDGKINLKPPKREDK